LNDSSNSNGIKNMEDNLFSTLLVRNAVAVSEPSTIAIFMFGIIAIGLRRN